MSNLIVGNTAQLSHFFPNDYDRISSRNIDLESIKKKRYNSVYILFAEQRTFLNENENFYIDINFTKTINLVDNIKNYVKKIVLFSTSELWNNHDGSVFIENKFNYNYTPYIKSKQILSDYINENRSKYQNVILIYPFNFNSPYRKNGFLFSKIFDSLLNKNKNTVGDLNFYRDIIHPKIIVEKSILTDKDLLIGSGELVNIQTYIKDIFNLHNMDYKDYITINPSNNLNNTRKNYFSGVKYSDYNELIRLTNDDIKKNTFS